MPDTCEVQFGLLPFNPADAVEDPDHDGLSNLAECQAGTHPRGFFTRYLAEGALNAFFDTRLALLNVGTAHARVCCSASLQPGGVNAAGSSCCPLARRTSTRTDLSRAARRPTSRPSSSPTSRSCSIAR